jgi:hypothetical protein
MCVLFVWQAFRDCLLRQNSEHKEILHKTRIAVK